MPKRARIGRESDNPLSPTSAPHRVGRPKTDKVLSVGVTLRESVLAEIEALAEARGVSRNALTRYLILHGVAELKAGRLELATKSTVELDMPDASGS